MHILRKLAVQSTVRDTTPLPTDADYQQAEGVWQGAKGPLAYDPDTDRVTKKNDVETGEDQKGH
jgi:hypothetical protein